MTAPVPHDDHILGEVERLVEANRYYSDRFFNRLTLIPDFGNLFESAPSDDDVRGPLMPGIRTLLLYEPEPLRATAEELTQLVGMIDPTRPESADYLAARAAADFPLSLWFGATADAFRAHLAASDRVAAGQVRGMVEVGAIAFGAYEMLRSAREDTLRLLQAGVDGLRDLVDRQDRTIIVSHLVVGATLVVAGANLASGTTVGSNGVSSIALNDSLKAAGGLVLGATTTTLAQIDGGNPREVIESVHREHAALMKRTEAALDEVHARTMDAQVRGTDRTNGIPELPPVTDVHSDEFDYGDASSQWRSQSEMGPEVDQAREAIRQALG